MMKPMFKVFWAQTMGDPIPMLMAQTTSGGYCGPCGLKGWSIWAWKWAAHILWAPGWRSWRRQRRQRVCLEKMMGTGMVDYMLRDGEIGKISPGVMSPYRTPLHRYTLVEGECEGPCKEHE